MTWCCNTCFDGSFCRKFICLPALQIYELMILFREVSTYRCWATMVAILICRIATASYPRAVRAASSRDCSCGILAFLLFLYDLISLGFNNVSDHLTHPKCHKVMLFFILFFGRLLLFSLLFFSLSNFFSLLKNVYLFVLVTENSSEAHDRRVNYAELNCLTFHTEITRVEDPSVGF